MSHLVKLSLPYIYPIGISGIRMTFYAKNFHSKSATLKESSAPLNVDSKIVTVSVVPFQIDEIILVQKI